MKLADRCRLFVTLSFFMSALAPAFAAGPAFERERTIAEELIATLDTGEAVWLKTAGGNKFLALLIRTFQGRHSTAVILLHGMSAHPDWPVVIAPLRRSLPLAGWATLSLQMPILSPETPEADYGETLEWAHLRIRAGVNFLREEGFENVILIGYSFGAATAAHYLANVQGHGVDAFAGVSMIARKFLSPSLDLLDQLERIDVPVLDVYGANDLKEVLQTTADRRLAISSNGRQSFRQAMIEGADHYYTHRDEELLVKIAAWLVDVHSRKTAGMKISAPTARMQGDP